MIINLITFRNEEFIKPCKNAGFTVAEFSPVAATEELKNLQKGSANYTIFEIKDTDYINSKATDIKEKIKFLYSETKLIIICSKITAFISKILIEQGVADCIEQPTAEKILSYIKFLQEGTQSKNGTFLILDDNQSHRNILNAIIRRFGYKTLITADLESLFLNIKNQDIQMTLVNLGTKNFDVNALVRKGYGNSDLKRVPLIVYKSIEEGLFVHEVINGLNRLTRVIYSPEEIYCLLIDMLFKKEIIALAHDFNWTLNFSKFKDYSSMTLPQIYYQILGEEFNNECIFASDKINSLKKLSMDLTTSLNRIEGIRWLRLAQSQVKKTICGEGV